MSSSRFLAPNTPGGLLSSIAGILTSNEVLIIQAIENNTYFKIRETPAGTINGTNGSDGNAVFTLANIPKPTGSEEIYVNGQLQTATTDYTISGLTITFVAGSIPVTGSKLRANYIFSPV